MRLMPITGERVLGVGAGVVSVDDRVVATQAGTVCPLDHDRAIYQQLDGESAVLNTVHLRTGEVRTVDPRGANLIRAGGGVWCASLLPGGTRSSGAYRDVEARVLDVGPDGVIATTKHHEGHTIRLYREDGTLAYPHEIPTLPLFGDAAGSSVRLLSGGRVVWVDGSLTSRAHGLSGFVERSPVYAAVPVEHVGQVYVLELGDGVLTLRPHDALDGWVVATGDTFGPDAISLDGQVLVGWSVGPGEMPGDGRTARVDVTAPRVPLGGDVSPAPVPTPTPDVPTPAVVVFGAVPAWPRKMLVSAFFECSERYGYTDAPIGNALTVVEDENDKDALAKTLAQVRRYGLPLVIGDGPTPIPPEIADLVLHWWASGGDSDALGKAVRRCRQRGEKMVRAYLDHGDPRRWPEHRPSWLTDDVVPEAQVYHDPGETQADFEARATRLVDLLLSYRDVVAVCLRFDDLNGNRTVGDTLADMAFYAHLIRTRRVCAVHLFADRRRGYRQDLGRWTESMSSSAELRAWGEAFARAVPTRPSRYDYWTPPSLDARTVLARKLAQDIDVFQLAPAETALLRSLL